MKSSFQYHQKIKPMTSRHILVVEDEEKIGRLLCDYLEKADYRTSTQANGDRVISQIKKDMPDLILLDIMLPGMDGWNYAGRSGSFPMFPSS